MSPSKSFPEVVPPPALPQGRFFRDAAGLSLLAQFARQVPSDATDAPFRAWVPSGSTGEDAFSAAIALLEALGDRPLRLFATGRDAAVIARARRAAYSAASAAKTVSPERLSRFFRLDDDAVRVLPGVTGSCVFAVHDLAENLPFVRLDAVYCPLPLDRWEPPVRARALDLFHFSLKPGGLLLLGAGMGALSDPRFAVVQRRAPLYRRAGQASSLDGRDLRNLLGRAAEALRSEWRGADPARESIDARRLQEEFVAMVSHELSTPLAAILGYTQTLRRGVNDPRRTKQFLGTIERNALRLMATVEGLVGAADARSQVRRPQPVALAAAAREAAALLREKARKAGVRVVVGASKAMALVDPADLPHVLENLIGNAIKYNRRGGKVTVGCRAEGELILLSVADTGPGIEPDALSKVFDRFYRAPATRHIKGTGLGLNIARGLAEANGGRLTVESELGRGAVFTLALPAA